MRSLIAFAATAVGLVLASPALARNTSVYGGVQAGYSWSSSEVTIPEYPSRFSMDNNGATAGVFGGVSWRLSPHWSAGLEGDGNWSDGQGRHLSGLFDTEEGPGGELYQIKQRWTADARVRVAYDMSEHTQIYAASGAAWANLETRYSPLAGGADTQTVSGWTAGVGAQHDYNDHVFTRAEVRYANYNTGRFFHNGPSTVDMESTSLLLGAGYRFGGRAAPPQPQQPQQPQPPPPACATSDFIVYFEWDRSNLNQAALETIESAAVSARACNVSAVMVVGHTDTSGSARYNMGLSERRASVVRDALVAGGISADAIRTQARGEVYLARQTRDGVREPLNRRTAVTISFR